MLFVNTPIYADLAHSLGARHSAALFDEARQRKLNKAGVSETSGDSVNLDGFEDCFHCCIVMVHATMQHGKGISSNERN